MAARTRTRILLGAAAGLTVTALFGATLAVPANAAPIDVSSKFKVGDALDSSRVIKGQYLVETAGTPLVKGGSRTSVKANQDSASAAAKSAGADVKGSFGALWTGISVTATEDQLKKLAQSPAVTAIYPVLRVDLPKPQGSDADSSAALSEIAAAGVDYTGEGIKVGVIDTGIDYNNPDLGGSGVQGNTADFGPLAPRVKYGHDFVGDAYGDDNPTPVEDADPDDCGGHGTHVAGIIGAEGSGDGDTVTGVAPKVTFGAYRVFGCDGSTSTAIILKAMSRAYADGMDIINMSLGSDFDSWPSYPDAEAAANLAAAGVSVVVAAGNSGDTGLFSAGSPAVGKGVISVASYESSTIRSKAIGVGTDKIAYLPVENTATAPADNVSTLTLRNASSITACTALAPVPAGTALLVKRGSCLYLTKIKNAVDAGAAAVVIYDTASGLNAFTTDEPIGIPAVSISGTQGAALYAKVRASGPQPMTWLALQSDIANPDGGRISGFSSAGLAADLGLVPTISAPGGKIYSTLPIEKGGHGSMSGTSMATPYVAGSVALLLQARPALKGHPADVAQLLYNTATPVLKATESGVTKYPEGVFRQGSGLVQVANAIAAGVTASPSTLELGEGTSHVVTVTLTNNTAETLTYAPKRVSGVSAAASVGSTTYVGTTTPKYGFGEVGFTAYTKSVTLAPGASADVKLKLTAPTKALKGKKGMLYGGWVQFTTLGAGNTVSVPFAGLRGDYQSVKVLNKYRLVDTTGKKWSLPRLGVELRNLGDDDGVYFLPSTRSNYYEFDLQDYTPLVWYHLDYPASDVRMKIYNVKTRKSYWAVIDPWAASLDEAIHFGPQPRDIDLQYAEFYGYYVNSTGEVATIPNGNYQLQLKVLKPLGTASKSSHWETYTSPKFWINR
jgi:subtilisin family serine protease